MTPLAAGRFRGLRIERRKQSFVVEAIKTGLLHKEKCRQDSRKRNEGGGVQQNGSGIGDEGRDVMVVGVCAVPKRARQIQSAALGWQQ